jgi:putative ABC transport system permease protein
MLKNYFKIAFRNLSRSKLLSFVNITGLAIGLACVILILLFVKDEWAFDKFNTKGKNIFRLVKTITDTTGKETRMGNTGLPHGPVFAGEIAEIESYCRINGWDMTIKKGTEGTESKVLFADPSIFNIFSIDVQQGNTAEMLKGRNSVVLTEAAVKKYFGTANAVGKTIDIEVDENFEPFMVTGVVKTPPLNTSISFDMLIPFERHNPTDAAELNEKMNNWGNAYLNTFFLLRKNADAKAAEKKLWQVYLNHNGEKRAKYQQRNGKTKLQFGLQPFFSMHLDKNFFASNGLSNWSDATYSYILSGLAILILIIASINFVNISLASSLKRSKEIGVRKVSGSSKVQVVIQFLSESFVVTAIAFVIAIVLVLLLLPLFNTITHRQFSIAYLLQPGIALLFIALIFLVALLAGFYPAFIASGFQPVKVLYNRFKLSGNNVFGKSLVVLQFIIAVALIISTIIFNRQFNYISTADLGYNPQNMIHLQFPWDKATALKQFKLELIKDPAIVSAGTKSGDRNKTTFEINGRQTEWVYYENIDDDFLKTLQIPVVKGSYLSYANVADTVSNCMVNETFVNKYLDKSKDPIGQMISQGEDKMFVSGVVKDYHTTDFKEKIEPVYFRLDKHGDVLNMYIKYLPGKEKAAVAAITKAYKAVVPYATLDYNFLQDWLMIRYEQDTQWKKIIAFAAFIAVLIAALGLFALSTLSVQQRIKEIGIRKVLGASVTNVAAIVSKDFLKLVCIAFVIASPLAWWVMNKWLQDFAYRINITWGIFALAAVAASAIALVTVGFQSIKAALMNPVKSLKSE